jgi:maltose-binding protein MalE
VPQYQGFIDAAKYAYITPAAPFYVAVQLIAAEGYQAVINGTPAAEAAATAESRIKEEIAKNE